MRSMRFCLCLLMMAAGFLHAADLHGSAPLRGKLHIQQGKATLETSDHKMIALEGDEVSNKVLGDDRLNGFEIEARGHFKSPDHFVIDPSHTHSLLVRKDGKLKLVTYWCDICSIRAYTPGPCVCCQRETTLDLRDPDDQ